MKFGYFKGHNSRTSHAKHAKFKLDLYLVVPNNISKFQIIPFMLSKVIEQKPFMGPTDVHTRVTLNAPDRGGIKIPVFGLTKATKKKSTCV